MAERVVLNLEVNADLIRLLDCASTASGEGALAGQNLARIIEQRAVKALSGDDCVTISRAQADLVLRWLRSENCLLGGRAADDFKILLKLQGVD